MSTFQTRYVSRLYRYRRATRLVVLFLFAVAILGPWSYTFDGAPLAERCAEPFFLLNEVRCASLMSGASMLAWAPRFATGLVYEFQADPRSLLQNLPLIALFSLFALPLASSLLVLLRGDSHRLRAVHLAFLLFAAVFGSLLPVLWEQTGITVLPRFWGMWLFSAVAWVALASELLMRRYPPESPELLPETGGEATNRSPDAASQQPDHLRAQRSS